MVIAAFVVLQLIISAKAGLVNAVEGAANVRIQEQVPAGQPIQTSSTGRVEILLNPGSFLRLGENSVAVLDSVELTNIDIRIVSGSAIIEAGSIEKDSPIRVTNGESTVSIVAPGIYPFSVDRASADQIESIKEWSRSRSKEIASANAKSAETDSASNSQTPAFSGHSLLPLGILPYNFPPGGAPRATFSFFQWYNGGYSFYQPLMPSRPLGFYLPFHTGRPRLPAPNLSHQPAKPTNLSPPRTAMPGGPASHPVPPRPSLRGRH